MSNADDNQGRRGLFRRNRPTEPVASAPLSDSETQNAETAVGESLPDADRKQARRPGLGRRKPAADGSWSSDAWEDGWDDDWSDRSSRAGVRPAADPRPAEVDAWLASSDDQLGDITRDIARKWTGNKQTEPINAAITWADDVPAAPSRPFVDEALRNNPFADEPRSGRFAESAGSLTSDDDLWDTPAATSDWSSAPNDASDLIDFADDDLPTVQPSKAPINLGSTWDDVERAVAAIQPVEPELKVQPTDFDEPVTATPDLAEQLSDSELKPDSSPEIASSFLEAEAPQPSSFVSTEPVETGDPRGLAFDFASSSESTELPIVEATPPEGLVHEANLRPTLNAPVDEFEAPVAEASVLAAPLVEDLTPSTLTVDEPTAENPTTDAVLDVAAQQLHVNGGTRAPDPVIEAPFVQGHFDTAKIPEAVESIATPIESVAAPVSAPESLIQAAPESPIRLAGRERLTDGTRSEAEMGPVSIKESVAEPVSEVSAAAETVQEFAAPSQAAAEITPTQPVERDEFLDSLYEELDDDDVPAQRKVVHQEPRTQIVFPVAEVEPLDPNQAITNDAVQIVETVAVAPLVDSPRAADVTPIATDDVDFAPSNTDFDRRVTGPSILVPQDPNADFDFGPDRPVYAPKVSPAIAPAIVAATAATTTATSQDPVVQEDDDDLFPATKADRFAAALDQLDDDQTDPSGLQEPAKKGFLRGRRNRKALDVEPLSAAFAAEVDEQTDLVPRPSVNAPIESTISPDKLVTATATTATTATSSGISALRDERTKPANQNLDAPENEDDLDDLNEYDDDDLDDYPEEAYFSPKLTKLLARAGFLLVALAAIRMLVLVGLAVRDGATDTQGTQDVFHRIGSAFAELGLAHGLMLIIGIAMAAAPALLGDPYIDDESRSIGATFGIGLIAAIFGVFGGFAAARLTMRVNDIAEIANPGVSSTTKWAKLAMNLVATAGLSLVAVVAAVRALGGDRPEQD